MIQDCKEDKIDRILVKFISRFSRNTLDCIRFVRELKELGVGITFEKENIDSLDAKGENRALFQRTRHGESASDLNEASIAKIPQNSWVTIRMKMAILS